MPKNNPNVSRVCKNVYVEIRLLPSKWWFFLELDKMGPGGPGPDTSTICGDFVRHGEKKASDVFFG